MVSSLVVDPPLEVDPPLGVGFSGGWCPTLEVVQAGEVVWCRLGLGGGGSLQMCLDSTLQRGLVVF